MRFWRLPFCVPIQTRWSTGRRHAKRSIPAEQAKTRALFAKLSGVLSACKYTYRVTRQLLAFSSVGIKKSQLGSLASAVVHAPGLKRFVVAWREAAQVLFRLRARSPRR